MATDVTAMKLGRIGLLAGAGLAGVAILLVLLFRGDGSLHAARPAPAGGGAIEVPVTPVVEKTVPVYLDYVGTTDAIRIVTLQAQVTGYLMRRAVPDGADVNKGDLLYQIDPRSYQAALDQAAAQAEKDTAALQYAKASHHRNSVMSKTGDVSIDALQQSASLELQGDAAIAADRAATEAAQLNLDYTQIRAPFPGRLSFTQVNEGALISIAGTQLNTLVQLDPIYATFNPPDADLPRIQEAQAKAAIPADVIAGEGTTAQYHGTLTFLDNTVGRSTGTITARATIDNPHHTLLPGQFIRVHLHIADQPNTLLVPQVAIGSSQLGEYVYVVGQGSKVEQRFVSPGADYGSLVAIGKGVARGDSIIVGNLLKIGPGMPVKPVPAAASEEATAIKGGTR